MDSQGLDRQLVAGSDGSAGNRRTVAPSSARRRSYSACSASAPAKSIGCRSRCVSSQSTIEGLTDRVSATSICRAP